MTDKIYEAVVFDLDGTLLDTLDDLAAAVNAALEESGMAKRTREEVRRFVGNGVAKLVQRAVPDGTSEEEKDRVLQFFKAYYSKHSRDLTRPYPGILEALDRLRESGIRMAIVSNKFQTATEGLSEYYFGDRIAVAAGENEAAGIRKKPAPDMVFSALEKLGTKRERALYVGDSEVDAQTAAAAGMDCLLVSWGFRERALLEIFHPVFLADDPGQMLDFIFRCGYNDTNTK